MKDYQESKGFGDHPKPASGLLVTMSLFMIGFLTAGLLIWFSNEVFGIRVTVCSLLLTGSITLFVLAPPQYLVYGRH
jgi:hypothetical protein